MNIKLVVPTMELKEKALEYRQEHFDNNEPNIHGSQLFDKIEDYEKWLQVIKYNSNIETVSENWVVSDVFFAVREDDDKIIGIIDLRHTLNDFLKDFGNCGYSVRPSERQKGYATEMLRLLVIHAKKCGLDKLQLSAKQNNIGSIKTILKNGGKFERSFIVEEELANVYLINLSN